MSFRQAGWFIGALILAVACNQDRPPEDTSALLSQMRIKLREMTREQVAYHSKTGQYASTLADLRPGGARVRKAGDDVVVEIHSGSATGWAASASHPSLPDQSCILVVGDSLPSLTTKGGLSAQTLGAVTCDESK